MSKLQPPSKVVKALDANGAFGPWWFNWLLQLFNFVAGLQGGVTATITTAKLTPGGANGSMTFTNGILTAHTDAT